MHYIRPAGAWMNSECFCQILPENIFKRSSYWSSSLADKKHISYFPTLH